MNTELLNTLFERDAIAENIKSVLTSFSKDHANPSFKKGFYIYGSSGVGKTQFVINILKSMNYDVIHYDAGDVRNKSLIENITSDNISSCNVLDMMHRRIKKIAIVMDEIDGMNSGDKGGLTALIKLIRQKKTKKQKLEEITLNPIICIGNYHIDKKIKGD
jgi:Cdc6-like AAA superfamily ATPase